MMVRRDIDEATEQQLRSEVKEQLRKRMRSLRRVLPEQARKARSLAICDRLRALPEFAHATTIIGYRAMSSEADPGLALSSALGERKIVGLPRVVADGQLALCRHREEDALEQGAFGIEEPSANAELIQDADVDLIIVPALAFDQRGHRIGYGRGYYDRLLPRLAKAFKVVIGYDFQYIVETPDLPGDVAVDAVVTDVRTVLVARGD